MASSEQDLQKILDGIGEGKVAPLYLVHGDEDFLVDQARESILEALVSRTGGEVERVDARDTQLSSILDSLMEISLFTTQRIVAVRQAQALGVVGKDGIDALGRFAETRGPEGNVLVLSGGQSLDKRTRFYKAAVKMGPVLTYDRLKGRALHVWMDRMARSRGLSMRKETQDALLARAGNSLRQIDLEMEKLIHWVDSGTEITPADVEAVVPRSKEDVIFDLTGALGEREVASGLKFLRELRFHGATPLMILSMLGREVRFLVQAKLLREAIGRAGWNERMGFDQFVRGVWPKLKSEVDVPPGNPRFHLLGANPYVGFLVLKRAGRFSLSELLRGLSIIARTDLVLKSTTQSPDALLERLVIELALPRETQWAGAAS